MLRHPLAQERDQGPEALPGRAHDDGHQLDPGLLLPRQPEHDQRHEHGRARPRHGQDGHLHEQGERDHHVGVDSRLGWTKNKPKHVSEAPDQHEAPDPHLHLHHVHHQDRHLRQGMREEQDARTQFQQLCIDAAGGVQTNPRRGVTPVPRRSATPALSIVGPVAAGGEPKKGAVQYQNDRKKPNVHAGLHHERTTKEFGPLGHVGSLIGEDMHRCV